MFMILETPSKKENTLKLFQKNKVEFRQTFGMDLSSFWHAERGLDADEFLKALAKRHGGSVAAVRTMPRKFIQKYYGLTALSFITKLADNFPTDLRI